MTKTTLLLATLLLATAALFAQTAPPLSLKGVEGATPIPPPLGGTTRAVVIGISDYQSPQIPNLHFAHRDAEAFAAWLRSPAGGSVPEENIVLLTNEQATAGKVWAALEGLLDTCGEGDLAVLYFSGHGDIEKVTMRQNGYLLCWDSPPSAYPTGGSFAVSLLGDIVETLSKRKRSRVVLISDACHAGKLAGSAINGTQTTSTALAQQFAHEVKIMSCQENEYALESEQWGGGRGLFSFHLLNGLSGWADNNADGTLTLREIYRYLEERVTADAAPHPQTPVVRGDLNFALARVNADYLAAMKNEQAPPQQHPKRTDMRGVLSGTDSVLYQAFEAALDRRDFLDPPDSCAEFFYRQLLERPAIRPLQGLMRRNYAAAIIDEIQQALNALLAGDPYETTTWRVNPDKYAEYPRYLTRAIELLGEKHALQNSLLAKKRYFEAYLQMRKVTQLEANPQLREAERSIARNLLREAIDLEPQAAYLYHAMATTFFVNNPPRVDSAAQYCLQAMEYAPNWLLPYLDMAYEYHTALNDFPAGENWLLLAQEQHPESYLVLERLTWLRQWQNRTDEALRLCHKMIELKPELSSGYGTLGVTHWMRGEYAQALKWLEKARQLPHEDWVYGYQASVYFCVRDFRNGYEMARELIQRDNLDVDHQVTALSVLLVGLFDYQQYERMKPYFGLADSLHGYAFFHAIANLHEGKALFALGRVAEAEQKIRGVFQLDNEDNTYFALADAWLGKIAAYNGDRMEAEAYFLKAMNVRGYSALDHVHPMEEACALFGHFLLDENRLDEAEQRFREALNWRYQNSWKGWYGLACLYAKKNDQEQALDCLEKALDNWFPIPEPIIEEPLLQNLHHTKRFQVLMAKHFPPGGK